MQALLVILSSPLSPPQALLSHLMAPHRQSARGCTSTAKFLLSASGPIQGQAACPDPRKPYEPLPASSCRAAQPVPVHLSAHVHNRILTCATPKPSWSLLAGGCSTAASGPAFRLGCLSACRAWRADSMSACKRHGGRGCSEILWGPCSKLVPAPRLETSWIQAPFKPASNPAHTCFLCMARMLCCSSASLCCSTASHSSNSCKHGSTCVHDSWKHASSIPGPLQANANSTNPCCQATPGPAQLINEGCGLQQLEYSWSEQAAEFTAPTTPSLRNATPAAAAEWMPPAQHATQGTQHGAGTCRAGTLCFEAVAAGWCTTWSMCTVCA